MGQEFMCIDKKYLEKIVKEGLESYEEALNTRINEIEKHEAREFSLLPPFSLKIELSFMIDYLEKENILDPLIKTKYSRLNEDFMWIKNNIGKNHSDYLYDKLKEKVDQFSSLVDYNYVDFEDDPIETCNDLRDREFIELILIELEDENYNLREIKVKIATVDEKLRFLYREGKDFILEKGIMNYFERPYYPDRFWFYHPKKLFEEMEEGGEKAKKSTP